MQGGGRSFKLTGEEPSSINYVAQLELWAPVSQYLGTALKEDFQHKYGSLLILLTLQHSNAEKLRDRTVQIRMSYHILLQLVSVNISESLSFSYRAV